MATCNLCPPGARDIPDAEMAAHLRAVHPEVDADGTRKGDGSTIVGDVSLEPAASSSSPTEEEGAPTGSVMPREARKVRTPSARCLPSTT
ncbi:hypothetical protein, partial [Actinoplanes philippinensis]|uniref:hypothetical protein n=1 Tax=Actinoplanes philippinensis TaxID=35752 RepID=UPI0033D24289